MRDLKAVLLALERTSGFIVGEALYSNFVRVVLWYDIQGVHENRVYI